MFCVEVIFKMGLKNLPGERQIGVRETPTGLYIGHTSSTTPQPCKGDIVGFFHSNVTRTHLRETTWF